MKNFVILSDSSCDLSDELLGTYKLEKVPFYVSLDGNIYLKENLDITPDNFYSELLNKDIYPKTSLPSVDDYCKCFEKYLKNGLDILCFTISSKLSGSYQSAMTASNILSETYHNNTIKIIDTKTVSVGQGMLVLKALRLKEDGLLIDDIIPKIMESIDDSLVLFTVNDLEYLKKGGRIGKAAAIAGNLLNIKPIIKLADGTLDAYSKVRGRKKALLELARCVHSSIKGDINDYNICVAGASNMEDAIFIKNILKEKFDIDLSYKIGKIGITIGAHSGPTAVGVGFMKK